MAIDDAMDADGMGFVVGNTLKRYVKSREAADVAPVVRCKDCARRGTPECGMYYECECGQQHTWETDNDFCSLGRKRDNA